MQESAKGSCQNRKNVKTLNTYNSKTHLHKLMEICILIEGNNVYSKIEPSLQLILCKIVVQKLNFASLKSS